MSTARRSFTSSREENRHGNQKQTLRKSRLGGKLSDESFITLFMVGVLVVVFGIACLIVPNFYKPQNMLNLITNNWFIIILGIGVTFLLITGNFDMSVGGIIALTGVLSVYFCQGVNVSQNALANGLGCLTSSPSGWLCFAPWVSARSMRSSLPS